MDELPVGTDVSRPLETCMQCRQGRDTSAPTGVSSRKIFRLANKIDGM